MSENDNSNRDGLNTNGNTLLAGNTPRGVAEVTELREPNLDVGFRQNANGSFSAVINLPRDRSTNVLPLLTVTSNYSEQLRDRVQNKLLEMGVPATVELNGKARAEGGTTVNPKIEGSVPIGPGTVGGGLDIKNEAKSSIELGITVKPGFPGLDPYKNKELQEFFDAERRNIYREWAQNQPPNGTTIPYSNNPTVAVGKEDLQGYLNNPVYGPFRGRDSNEIWRNETFGSWAGRPDPNPTTNPDMRRPNGPRSEGPNPDSDVATTAPTMPTGTFVPTATMPPLAPAALNPNTTPTPGNDGANTTPTNPTGTFVPTATMPLLGTTTTNPPSADLSNGTYGQLYGKIQEGVNNLPTPLNPNLLRVDNNALTNALTFDAAQRGFDPTKEVNIARGKGDNENMVFAANGSLNNPATPIARVDSNNLQQPTTQQIAALPPPPAATTEDIALRETRTVSGRSVG